VKFYRVFLIIFMQMLMLSLGGCRDNTVQSVVVQLTGFPVEEGALSLKQAPLVSPEKEGQLIKTEEQLQTPRYTINYGKEFPQPSAETAFQLDYRSSVPLQTRFSFESGESNTAELPATGSSKATVIVPLGRRLPRDFYIRAVESDGVLQQGSPEGSPENNPKKSVRDTSEGAEGLFQLEKVLLKELNPPIDGARGVAFSLPKRDSRHPLYQYRYRIDYHYQREGPVEGQSDSGDADEVVPLEMSSEENSASFNLFAKEGDHSIYFYSSDLEFTPSKVVVGTGLPGFRVKQVSQQSVSMYAENSPPPISADMGTILRYEQQAWRRSDWELFSWNLFPSILVFDFRDYDIQAAFLKRLAFFVEKKGSAGKLLSNSVLDPLHGWNAHDYRAADLAAFYQKARAEKFPLNPEEELLRELLLERGIIKKAEGDFRPGEGGIISLARQSSSRLRYIFATHEGYHGLFFASLEYRQAVHRVWDALSDNEREFWKLFLDWKWYNTGDPYLLENEFQAYLMQQHHSYVDTYFKDYIIPRYLSLFPEYQQRADYFLEEYENHFSRSAHLIESAAQSLVGISAGDLVCLREVEQE